MYLRLAIEIYFPRKGPDRDCVDFYPPGFGRIHFDSDKDSGYLVSPDEFRVLSDPVRYSSPFLPPPTGSYRHYFLSLKWKVTSSRVRLR